MQAGLNKTLNVPLPQVAVVGSQSSGKSSVLEALVRELPPFPHTKNTRKADVCDDTVLHSNQRERS